MISSRDSFLHFLAANLNTGVLHPVRVDPNDRATEPLKMNAVNVAFGNVTSGIGFTTQQAFIDVVYDSENDAVDAVDAVFDLLKDNYATPLYDYADPADPVALGSNLMWDRHRISFKRIATQAYSHWSCTLSTKFYTQ